MDEQVGKGEWFRVTPTTKSPDPAVGAWRSTKRCVQTRADHSA